MRSKKELGKIFLKNESLFIYGLCQWTYYLMLDRKITVEEEDFIKKIIKKNKPLGYYLRSSENRDYYWKCGKIKPRIKWVKKHLN